MLVHIKTLSIKSLLILCLLAGLTILLLTSLSLAREPIRTVTGTVTKVSDGDTIQVTTPEKTKLRVRLYGIDAPEMPKLDFDTSADVQEYQCSISSLEKLTNLDFSAIEKFDTFTGANPNESLKIGSEEALDTFIAETFSAKPHR
jgi:hypothetical protein